MKTIQDYTNYCTEEQTRRAFELGMPIETVCTCESIHEYQIQQGVFIAAPTTQQMMNWLRDKFGILVITKYNSEKNVYFGCIKRLGDLTYIGVTDGYFSYEKAEITAIDEALSYGEEIILK